MPVKLRLMRMGKTKQPTYRVVASDSRSPRNGRFIELLGTYEPRREPSAINVKADKIREWIANGAQPTERVQKILVAEGVLDDKTAAKTMVAKKAARRPAKPTKAEKAAAAEAEAKKKAEEEAAAAKAEADAAAESEEASAETSDESTEENADA